MALQSGAPPQLPLPPQPWQVEEPILQLGHQAEVLEMGLEKRADQGFLRASLGPQLVPGEAQVEDLGWLLGSG